MVSVVGTANLDIRSFDLNFEIMGVIYSRSFGAQLEQKFMEDLENSKAVSEEEIAQTGTARKLLYASARLSSSFL